MVREEGREEDIESTDKSQAIDFVNNFNKIQP